MKHKTLRTLLCVILTVCFCLSAIAPVSAAGLFSGDSGAASIFDEWIRSLKDRFIEKNPGTDEDPAEQTATGDNFIRIFHLDCGRKYFSVEQIEAIIDQLAANHYTHIELAFGNDGFRFLLDENTLGDITVEGKTYTAKAINEAIHNANVAYCEYKTGSYELTQSDMDEIITYATQKGIGVIPLLNIPGHTNTLVNAMYAIGAPVSPFTSNNNSKGYPTQSFNVLTEGTAEFVIAFVKKYVDYFAEKECTYFNFGADECGYDNFSKEQYTALASMLTNIVSYIKANNMTPMMFNDGLRSTNSLADSLASNKGIAVCFWEMQKNYYTAEQLKSKGFTVINTHNKWYYVAGNGNSTSKNWSDWAYHYDYAQEGIVTYGCKSVDGGGTADKGCMLAYWCDDPTANYDSTERSRVYELIGRLANKNPDYFTAPVTPVAPTITVSANSLTVDGTATLSTSDGSLATWASSDEKVLVLEVVATKDVTAASVTVRAVGAGTATVTAKLSDGTTLTSETITVRNKGEVTWEREETITVTANNTENIEISGVNYSGEAWETDDPTIATVVSVTGQDAVEAKEVYTETRVTYSTLAKNAKNNQGWIKTDYYCDKNNAYYPVYVKKERSRDTTYYSHGYSVSDSANAVETIGNKTSNSSQSVTVYTKTSTDAVPASTTFVIKGLIAGKSTSIVIGNTKYTINVIAEDLSSVTPLAVQTWITNYAIESANKTSTSNAYWAASWGVGRNGEAYYVNVSAQDAYGEEGKPIAELLPTYNYIEYGGTYWADHTIDIAKTPKELVVWSGRIHNADDSNVQKIYGKDYSNSGTEFNYIRYYGDKWEVSPDGSVNSWVEVAKTAANSNSVTGEQVVVYYMIRSTITAEITTDVADWGSQYGETAYNDQVEHTSQYFVLLDFAVKYEGGAINPDTFPVENKTFAFHCQADDSGGAVHQNGNYYYRELNNFRAVNTSEYEVYMVTVTMTSDTASETITSTNAKTANGYTYDGEEQVLWAVDSETREQFNELKDYTSISGSKTYSGCKIGGEPYIRGVEVYRKHGALITYYVRVKTVEEKLTVNYYVDGLKPELIHTYDIGVKAGTRFKDGIAIGTEEPNTNKRGYLINSEVTNAANNEEKINVDLTKINQIPAKYRFADFECVKVETIGENTVVNLYYKFSTSKAFVVDFGLPLTITKESVNDNQSLKNANITGIKIESTSKYASVETTSTYDIVYTLKKPLDIEDVVKVTYSGDNTETGKHDEITYTISIIPATNVLYEENFMSEVVNTGTTNTSPWTKEGSTATPNQTLEEFGKKTYAYGYDPAYGVDKTNNLSMGSAYKTSLTVTADQFSAATSSDLVFTFEGTGYDIISACGTNTGMLIARTYQMSADGKTKTLKALDIIDTYFCGDANNIITGDGVLDYQVPVFRKVDLDYATYRVEVRGYLRQGSGVLTASTNGDVSLASLELPVTVDYASSANSVYDDILADIGAVDLDGVEVNFTFMDNNSILNGGTGIFTDRIENELVSKESMILAPAAELNANTNYTAGSADVYVDAFRVYNPLDVDTDEYENKFTKNSYGNDGEGYLKYGSVYEYVLAAGTDVYDDLWMDNSAVYVEYDGNKGIAEIVDYHRQGPNNEVYLSSDGSNYNYVGFIIDGWVRGTSKVMVSASVVSGNPSLKAKTSANASVAIAEYNSVADEVQKLSRTEMYYDVTDKVMTISNASSSLNGKSVLVIGNESNDTSVLAISNIKISSNCTAISGIEGSKLIENVVASQGESSFTPKEFSESHRSKVKSGNSAAITIKASDEVTSFNLYSVEKGKETLVAGFNPNWTNKRAYDAGRTKTKSYSAFIDVGMVTVETTKIYHLKAVNADGVESNPIEIKIVVVQ